MNNDSPAEVFELTTYYPSQQEVEAEKAFLQFLEPDKVFSKKVIYQKLRLTNQIPTYNELPDFIAHSYPWAQEIVNFEAQKTLIDWALSQIKPVQEVIFRFMSDPDGELESTIKALLELNIKLALNKSAKKPQSIKEIVLSNLPAHFDELTDLIRLLSPTTRRPAATLRQIIRSSNLTREENIISLRR